MLRRKDDYEAGQQAAQIVALREGVERIEKALADHRKEEADTWTRFEASISELKLWRAKMMGVAGIVAAIVTAGMHFLFSGKIGLVK